MKKKRETAETRLIEAAKEMMSHKRGEIALPVRSVTIPDDIDVRSIREEIGLSQSDFAETFCINQRSLQDWEQGRRKPESAVRAYLTVIKKDHAAVRRALGVETEERRPRSALRAG